MVMQISTTPSLTDEPEGTLSLLTDEVNLLGMDVGALSKALARFDSDADYRQALTREQNELGWLDSPQEAEAREFLCWRLKAAELWPIVRSALERKPRVTFDGDLSDGSTGARFPCFQCREPMHIFAGMASIYDKSPLAVFNFSHDELGCPTDALGDDAFLEWLGLGSFTGAASFDLAFLDGDAAGQEDTPDWLIPGMFARGDYWSLFGPSEVGKSLLALDWSLQMARAGERVLYLDRENSREVLRKRLKKMGARREDFTNLLLKPLGTDGVKDLATEAGAQGLHDLVKRNAVTVVVLDTISKFSEVGQAVQSDRWQKMYNHSFVPLLAAGVAIGQLDHTGLGDKTRERDSNAKRDNVSVAWALTWRGKDKLTLSRAKNRPNYASPSSLAVERVDEPVLTHVIHQSVPDEIKRALAELDRLGVPESAGRMVARDYLKRSDHHMSDALLSQAIKARKAA